jgi:hypothetical protein
MLTSEDLSEKYEAITNDYGCLYLKGGTDIKARMNEVPTGDLDFGYYCGYNRISKKQHSICKSLVSVLSVNDKFIGILRDTLIDHNNFYNVMKIDLFV